MALVTTTEMFKKAYDGGYAIGAFNVNNMEIVQGITEAAGELKSPVILQVSKGARAYANHTYLVKLVEAAVIENPDIPIALHLDHGDSFELCKSCIDGGFTSVMIDASHYDFEKNIEITKKVVEYAPAFSVPEEVRQQIFEASIRLAKHVGYKNAGTLEFLVDADNNAYFIEMNPRVQVEHTITEMVTGIDIVQTQVLVAEGYSLDSEEIGIGSQEEVTCNGYSIQTRITTEDPMNNFLPDR